MPVEAFGNPTLTLLGWSMDETLGMPTNLWTIPEPWISAYEKCVIADSNKNPPNNSLRNFRTNFSITGISMIQSVPKRIIIWCFFLQWESTMTEAEKMGLRFIPRNHLFQTIILGIQPLVFWGVSFLFWITQVVQASDHAHSGAEQARVPECTFAMP